MKQFMSLSALILSAACLCAHTPSFASSSLDKAGQATGEVVGGTVGATGDLVKGVGNGLHRIGDAITSGFKKLTGHKQKRSKNTQNTPNQNKKNGATPQPSVLPTATPAVGVGAAATVQPQPTSSVTSQPAVSPPPPTTSTTSRKTITTTTTATTTTPDTAPTVPAAPPSF